MRYNPFNPQLPARTEAFVGRVPEIDTFKKFLYQTTHGSPMNMSITGNRGMGKTSILNKFEEIAREQGCLVVTLSNREGRVDDINGLSSLIVDALRREIVFDKVFGQQIDGMKEFLASLKPTFSYEGIDLSVERKVAEEKNLAEALVKIWDKAKTRYNACVILIDEAESLERIEGALEFLREVFQKLGTTTRYMVVLGGKMNFSQRMSESFSPLNRFFAVSEMKAFDRKESDHFISNQMSRVEMSIEQEALATIHEMSEGHPYVLVATCFVLFNGMTETAVKMTKNDVDEGRDEVLRALGQDFFSAMYHPLTPKAKDVLELILDKCEQKTFAFADVTEWTGWPKNTISPYMLELTRKGILNKHSRGQYEFFHGLFMEYIRRMDD